MPISYQSNQNIANVQTGAMVSYMNKVYRWMAIGLLITALIAYYIAAQPAIIQTLVKHIWIVYASLILQLGLVIYISASIERKSYATLLGIYLGYSVLSGITFSLIFLLYTQASINSAFFVTAIAFGGLSLFGYTTKKDLGPIGTFCMMALFGFIGIMVILMIFPKWMTSSMQIFIGIAGVLIFSGLTAYDTQKIKQNLLMAQDGQTAEKLAIVGALTLYLDFINLFLSFLRLMGQRNN